MCNKLTCEEIKNAVEKYNGSQYPRLDIAFKIATEASNSVLGKVCLVADWGSIKGFDFEDRTAVAEAIVSCWPALRHFQQLREQDWLQDFSKMTEAIDLLKITRILKPTESSRRELSFLSKFLHWCVSDAFPLWDSDARDILGTTEYTCSWQVYQDWAQEISRQIKNHPVCLLNVRTDGESLVRTLDKALWSIKKFNLERIGTTCSCHPAPR